MRERRFVRAAIGLLAGVMAIGPMALPASATTVSYTVTSGTIDFYAADSTLFESQDMTDGDVCEAPQNTFDVTPSHNSYFTYTKTTFQAVWKHWGFSVWYVGFEWVTMTGVSQHGMSPNTFTFTGTSSLSLDLHTGTSCEDPSTFPACSIQASSIATSGTGTGDPATFATSDTAVMSGDNGSHGDFGFEVAVGGSSCGSLVALDDGSVVITNETIHVD